MRVVLPEQDVVFIVMNVGTDQRVVKVCRCGAASDPVRRRLA
jgi:hypothetical protein